MRGDYKDPISVEDAVKSIVTRKLLLPSIQRKFAWSSSQICTLFDSIMRGYPINTFMFWRVDDEGVKRNMRFYQFLERYCERFEEDNPEFDTKGHDAFDAVIDGQQRLTSLYIGLKGSYAYKLPRKHWPSNKDDTVLPPRRLFLNLSSRLVEEESEGRMIYDFKFLTEEQQRHWNGADEKQWFCVGDILNFKKAENFEGAKALAQDWLESHCQSTNGFPEEALTRLYQAFRLDTPIHFYQEKNQSIDHVLDIFIRTNHGGTPLDYSDLLMSVAVSEWGEDARSEIDGLVTQVRGASDMGFFISRDFALKTALALTDGQIRFSVKNFSRERVKEIQNSWWEIKACIIEVFRLIRSFGLNDASLRAKNAVIPLAYYLFHKEVKIGSNKGQLYESINKKAFHGDDRKRMQQWLHMALLKRVFGGQGDSVLTEMRKLIRENIQAEELFPLGKIVDHYKGSRKNLSFDDDFIDELLRTRKGDSSCFSILALLYPDLDFTQALDIDHLHPEVAFTKKRLDAHGTFRNPAGREFYEDRRNWDSILNCQLLNSSLNRSKSADSLCDWFDAQKGLTRSDLLIPEGVDLSFENFEAFIGEREGLLRERLKAMVSGAGE